ncbi:MAG: hypothetical protein V3T16_12490, partial [Gemmatimonadales bacterium]
MDVSRDSVGVGIPSHRDNRLVRKTAACLALGLIAAGATARDAHGQARDSTPVELEPIVVMVAGAPSLMRALPYAVSVGGDSSVTRAQPRLALGEIMTALPGIDVQNR